MLLLGTIRPTVGIAQITVRKGKLLGNQRRNNSPGKPFDTVLIFRIRIKEDL